MAQMDGIIKTLQDLYTEWKRKYVNMVVLTNYALRDFPDKIKEADQIMCQENTPHQVFNFVKFYKKTMAKLIINIEAFHRDQGVTFRVNL